MKTSMILILIIFGFVLSDCSENNKPNFNSLPVKILCESNTCDHKGKEYELPEYVYLSLITNSYSIRNQIENYSYELSGKRPSVQNESIYELIEFSRSFASNKLRGEKLEYSIDTRKSVFDDDYVITHIKTCYSNLNLDFDFRICLKDSNKVKEYFDDEYPYNYRIPKSLIKDTMKFYRYGANISFHFELKHEANGVEKYKHVVLHTDGLSTLYSPVKL